MGEIAFEGVRLGSVRFGVSPMAELGLSLMAVRRPQRHPFHAQWLARTADARAAVGTDRLLALMDDRNWSPDLLYRQPAQQRPTFEAELAALARLPARTVVADLARVDAATPRVFGRTDDEVRREFLATLEHYWETCFASWWPRFRAVLEADITYRATRLAYAGLDAALAEIQPWLIIEDGRVVVVTRQPVAYTKDVSVTGLVLLPTLVKWGTQFPCSAEADAVLTYPARGRAGLTGPLPGQAPEGVVGVLGKVRSALLHTLDEPLSCTAIAHYTGVTTSAVNQHVRALRAAGLLESRRYGRYVLYQRTPLADAFLAAASPDGGEAEPHQMRARSAGAR